MEKKIVLDDILVFETMVSSLDTESGRRTDKSLSANSLRAKS